MCACVCVKSANKPSFLVMTVEPVLPSDSPNTISLKHTHRHQIKYCNMCVKVCINCVFNKQKDIEREG